MKKYPRTPAFFVLLFTALAAYTYLKDNRPQVIASHEYESKIFNHTASDDDWKNYVRALAKEGKYDRLIPAFKHCIDNKLNDRSINFIYIEALSRQTAQNDARDKLYDFLDSQVQLDPKLVLDAFDNPSVAVLKSVEKFDLLNKTAQKNAAD